MPQGVEFYDRKILIDRDLDAFKRMFLEVLLVAYNDIMTKEDYCNTLMNWLNTGKKYYKNKLDRHYRSLVWFVSEARDTLCFEILELENLSDTDILKSILLKFSSPVKFKKMVKIIANKAIGDKHDS